MTGIENAFVTEPVELPSQIINWLNEYKKIQSQMKDLTEKLDIARAHIELALGESELGLIDGQPAIKWGYIESNRFDQKKAKEILTPEQVEACTVVQRARRFEPVREA
jgi:predicted phage-related endonuclease